MDKKNALIFPIFLVFFSVLLSSFPAYSDDNPKWSKQGFDFWINETGPTGPVFTGPHQYPFICFTLENGLGQPLVDNQDGIGNAVFPEIGGIPIFTADPVGYSQNCSIPTRVDYFYYSTAANRFLPLVDPADVPVDVEQIQIDDAVVNFVVRLERGTINRFIYSIAMLAPFPEGLESPDELNNSAWNQKLVYKFQGGIGIGHWQGSFSLNDRHALHYESLKRGYAVAYSTGTKTSTHYNLKLAEETAMMVKHHFKAMYGKPKYTVGIGGSGGAVQQYVIAQNNRHIIDAAIPQLSYPDMITQTIHVGDCELLERYFDLEYTLDSMSRWGDWLQRTLIEGMATNNVAFKLPWSLSPFAPVPGSSECINGWRGQVPFLFNPTQSHPDYLAALALYRYPPEVAVNTKWTHWNDLGNIYPQDENGIAFNTWDNVGVQYGLTALVKGDLSTQEFLDINACVGGWKQSQEMGPGNYPWNQDADPATFDPWDQANMNLNPACKFGQSAPRTEGSIIAMNAAYKSGHVFKGKLKIPVIDLRWYLEPVLDLHHTQASFAVRARLLKRQGHAKNQVIWFTECSGLDPVNLKDDCAFDPTGNALDVIDEWMSNIKSKRNRGVLRNKPADAVDACFYGDGSVLYSGPDAWDGILNNKPEGSCTTAFPIFSTSRIVSGGDIKGDIFKCALKPVDKAFKDGTYNEVVFTDIDRARLKEIFPAGVCDYNKKDVGKP